VYTEFYNLREKPFNLTPSPRFLYLGEHHKEALNLLKYGVMERKGFILLTGEIGTGKTTMVHALLSGLDDSVQYIHLSNPVLTPGDFMEYLAFSVFRKKIHFKSKSDFLVAFEEFLLQCLRHQENVILIIDEAQKLSFELLEEIRLLSNMETGDEKLLNIFLVGQPELNEKLRDPQCLPLLQRISIRYHIPPLDMESTRDYVATRLKIAGAQRGDEIFPKSAVKAIHQYSGGYPRMINILADNSLLLGYSKGTKTITPQMVKQCHEDLSLDSSFPKDGQEILEPYESEELKRGYATRYWKWAAVLGFLIAIAAVGITQTGQNLLGQVFGLKQASYQSPLDKPKPEQVPVERDGDLEKEDSVDENQVLEQTPIGVQAEHREDRATEMVKQEGPKEREVLPYEKEMEPSKSVIVKKGDTLIQLAAAIYGRADDAILKQVQQYNPELRDINKISIGQELRFPPLALTDRGLTFTVHIGSFKHFELAQNLFQELLGEGYEAYIMPVYDTEKGKFFRVTLGNFKGRKEAENYAAVILKKGISDFAKTMELETR
jgi:type II secretory pathway predicted ATPase ExeA/LysM repeat protein